MSVGWDAVVYLHLVAMAFFLGLLVRLLLMLQGHLLIGLGFGLVVTSLSLGPLRPHRLSVHSRSWNAARCHRFGGRHKLGGKCGSNLRAARDGGDSQ